MISRRDFLKGMFAATAVAAAPKFIFDYGANLWKTDGAITAEQIQRLLDQQTEYLLKQPAPTTFLVSPDVFKQHYTALVDSIYRDAFDVLLHDYVADGKVVSRLVSYGS